MFRCKLSDGSGYIELKRITQDRDRHGNVRLYVRLPGRPRVRLRQPEGTPEFVAEYKAAIAGTTPPTAAPSVAPTSAAAGTLAWLIQRYFTSAEFQQLGDRTKYVRRKILGHIVARDGAKPFALLEPHHLRRRRDEDADRPEAANIRIKALRQVFAVGIANDWCKSNPARDVPFLPSNNPRGFHSWTDEEIAQWEKCHPIGSMARLALALHLYLSQRRSDVVLLGPRHVHEGKIRFTQFKGRNKKSSEELELPIVEDLQRIIDATPCGDETFLVTEFGKPFTANGYGNRFQRWRKEAGLPARCSSHGLRKAGARLLAERGRTAHQIMAVTGHTTLKEVDRYTKAASQKRLAEEALAPEIVAPFARRKLGATKPARNRLISKER